MISLLGITLATSGADSLNPIAIAQQLFLQQFTKKKTDIKGFIWGIGLTNFTAGLLVYYGLAEIMNRFLKDFLKIYPWIIPAVELSLGIGLVVYLLIRHLFKNPSKVSNGEPQQKKPAQTLTFSKLFGLGIVSCGLELTSALPYFAYLAILLQYTLAPWQLLLVLTVYNLIYSAPLILIYICSIHFSDHLDKFYTKFSRWMSVITRKILPLVVLAIAVALIIHGLLPFL